MKLEINKNNNIVKDETGHLENNQHPGNSVKAEVMVKPELFVSGLKGCHMLRGRLSTCNTQETDLQACILNA